MSDALGERQGIIRTGSSNKVSHVLYSRHRRARAAGDAAAMTGSFSAADRKRARTWNLSIAAAILGPEVTYQDMRARKLLKQGTKERPQQGRCGRKRYFMSGVGGCQAAAHSERCNHECTAIM